MTVGAWAFALLREQLGPRAPRFVESVWLGPGTICWDVSYLPTVFVAPDIWRALQSLSEGKDHGKDRHTVPI